ncbi:hypothetical protein HDU99_004842 [Rhizoclosmatium hyalinum]|nr:hypothetical protein HDU99_004842 [Rhizoclosmatium hyalinum]
MFRRNGEVAETEAWVQRVKATSFMELLYFMVVVIGSGVGFLLFFELIQNIAIAVGGTTRTPTTPPATGQPGGQPGAGTPPPSYPYPYPYPPYCQPVPAPPSGGIPPTTPPAGGVPASGTFVITPGLLQLMNFFVFCCVVVYLAKKISKRPSRPLATQEQSCNQLAYEPIR